ncbi:MAG: hypothetical protein QS721_15485 [Candidatus Endonucleobacter sp. (ex Gigantidas childressi)]|nr:hypothetical protein [Candidatus Endonucleobacter sp. (ex Gigantidas childressi)]
MFTECAHFTHLLFVGPWIFARWAPTHIFNGRWLIFQDATLLPALAHPDHLLLVGLLGFTHLLPGSNLKSNEYRLMGLCNYV